jgi:hypothetical protein
MQPSNQQCLSQTSKNHSRKRESPLPATRNGVSPGKNRDSGLPLRRKATGHGYFFFATCLIIRKRIVPFWDSRFWNWQKSENSLDAKNADCGPAGVPKSRKKIRELSGELNDRTGGEAIQLAGPGKKPRRWNWRWNFARCSSRKPGSSLPERRNNVPGRRESSCHCLTGN